jgi:hypothetical protein
MFNRTRQIVTMPTYQLISFRNKYIIPQVCFFVFFFLVSLYYYFTINEANYNIMVLSVVGCFIIGLLIIFDSLIILFSEFYNLQAKNKVRQLADEEFINEVEEINK